jgi:transcriptional regulator with XRE-family HTH domain
VRSFAAPRLWDHRLEQRLTQHELARRAGIGRTSIVHLEQPGGTARIETIRKLAAALSMADEDLIGGPTLPLRRPPECQERPNVPIRALDETDEGSV